jgi:archaeal preflagellin peptidase FlaK
VTDRLWQVLGIIGIAIGAVVVAPGGLLPVGIWLLVGALALEHMFGWDRWLGDEPDRRADLVELVAYLGVGLVVAVAWIRYGLGSSAVPIEAVALLVTVLLARGLFEGGVLYGGADAKALMIAGTLVPLFPSVVLRIPAGASSLLSELPFAFNLLLDAALLSIAVPIAIGVRNAARHEFSFPRGFSGYSMEVSDLPAHYVWLEDPSRPGHRIPDVETSEEDRQERARLARELTERGVRRVWVTPQIPFLVLMALGAVAAVLAGNVILDVLAWA